MTGKHVFGVGTGRCGTRTVAERISWMTPNARHEGWIYRNGQRRREAKKFRHLIQGRPSSTWNTEAIYQRWKYLHSREHSFEAAHYFTGSLDMLLEAFPEAKLLHLVRPAPEVVYSFLRWSQDGCYRAAGAHLRPPGHVVSDSWVDWCDSFPEFPGVVSRIEGYAMHWQWTNRLLESVGKRLGQSRYMLVWLSDLDERWDEVVRFIDPPKPQEIELHVANKARKPFIPDEYGEVEKVCEEICTWRPNMTSAMSVFPGLNSDTAPSGS